MVPFSDSRLSDLNAPRWSEASGWFCFRTHTLSFDVRITDVSSAAAEFRQQTGLCLPSQKSAECSFCTSSYLHAVTVLFLKKTLLLLPSQGEYIFSLKDLQFHTFAGVVREKFGHLLWEDDLLGVLQCLVDYSPATL